MAAHRRNGMLSSCEPCRISKLRCDHSTPVCSRCTARHRADQCIYHPAPLTKSRTTGRQAKSREETSASSLSSHELLDWVPLSPSVSRRGVGSQTTARGTDSFARPRFLGPTSHFEYFHENKLSPGPRVGSFCGSTAETLDSKHVEIGAQILSLLDGLPFFAQVLERRFSLYEGWIFGPQITRETLKTLATSYHHAIQSATTEDRHARLLEWSKVIFRNTATTVETQAVMNLQEYISIIAPRWDTIGLIFALLGTATYHIHSGDAVFRWDELPGKDKRELRTITVAVSDMCLQFCSSASAISDPLCWATMQHISFMLEMHGSTDHRIWQRLGDVTTLVFALGLHQREVDERAPFFLSEIRKRTMVAAYSMDKELATFLGRPPRICRRYCNFHIPLDIGWEDLLADASTRDAVVQRLDANGWDSRGGSEGAKPRVSMLSNIYREMILELSFSREMDNLMHKIEEIRHESNHMRLGLPIFLRWSPENEHPSAASLHLEFLYQDFLLCQMLVERTGDGSNSLIEKSLEILVLLLDIVSKQTRAGNVSHFTIFDLCYIGLPAAGVLSKELLRHSQESGGGHPRESNFARSEIIQRLSVFAAQLETFFPSREGDYDTCMKGLAFIRQVLDIVLTPNTTDSSMLGCDVAREEENDLLAGPCTDDIELLALMEDFDWEQEMRPFSS